MIDFNTTNVLHAEHFCYKIDINEALDICKICKNPSNYYKCTYDFNNICTTGIEKRFYISCSNSKSCFPQGREI